MQAFFVFSLVNGGPLVQRAILFDVADATRYARQLSLRESMACVFSWTPGNGVVVSTFRDGNIVH